MTWGRQHRAAERGLVLSYWSDKSVATTSWVAPDTLLTRGTTGGHRDRPRDLIACRQRHLAHPLPQITFTGYASATGNAPAGQVSLPATAAEGETAVLFATLGVGPATLTAPEGWAQISGKSINGITGAVFTKTVTAADLAAPQVPVTWAGGTAKYTLSLATYEGVGGEHPV